MYTVVRQDVRPNTQTPFFLLRLPYVKQLVESLGISRQEVLSEDGLQLTCTINCPDEAAWIAFSEDPTFVENYLTVMREYNTLNGITSSHQVTVS